MYSAGIWAYFSLPSIVSRDSNRKGLAPITFEEKFFLLRRVRLEVAVSLPERKLFTVVGRIKISFFFRLAMYARIAYLPWDIGMKSSRFESNAAGVIGARKAETSFSKVSSFRFCSYSFPPSVRLASIKNLFQYKLVKMAATRQQGQQRSKYRTLATR